MSEGGSHLVPAVSLSKIDELENASKQSSHRYSVLLTNSHPLVVATPLAVHTATPVERAVAGFQAGSADQRMPSPAAEQIAGSGPRRTPDPADAT